MHSLRLASLALALLCLALPLLANKNVHGISAKNESEEASSPSERNHVVTRVPYILDSDEWDNLKSDINTFWLLIMATLVFMMQTGFTLLEAGCIRSKNIVNLLFKNFMDVAMGAVAFYLLGFGFAYGERGNSFIGTEFFALDDVDFVSDSHFQIFFSSPNCRLTLLIATTCSFKRTPGLFLSNFICRLVLPVYFCCDSFHYCIWFHG